MNPTLKSLIVDQLSLLQQLYPCEFRVLNYYVGHKRLIVSACQLSEQTLPDTERMQLYIEFIGLHYMQIVPRWDTETFKLLEEGDTKILIEEIGLAQDNQRSVPLVFIVENNHPKLIVVCSQVYVHHVRPESSDYLNL